MKSIENKGGGPDASSSVSKDIYNGLVSAAGSKARLATLSRLKEACDALVSKGIPVRLKAIEREVRDRHGATVGPSAQTIANDREGMRRYVSALEREDDEKDSGRGKVSKGDTLSMILASVDDHDTRSRIRDMHERGRLAESALTRAKALLASLSPGADVDALIDGRPANVSHQGLSIPSELVAEMSKAVSILSDENRLSAVGLIREQGGRIRRRTGTCDELFPPSVTMGFEEIVRLLSQHE